MLVTVHKMWITETEIEAPDGLDETELFDWLNDNADAIGNDNHQWDHTFYMHENGDEIK